MNNYDICSASISVFGLGKLGSAMVGCFASAGFNVTGVDIDPRAVDLVSRGIAPVPEPGLQNLFDLHKERISAVQDAEKAVMRSDISFIIVPTPSQPSGEFDVAFAVNAARTIGTALATKDSYHLIVLTSTVLPGACERSIIPEIERASGKLMGEGFGFCYSPEFIAIGNVIEGLLNPDFFLIGESDQRAGDMLEAIYRKESGAGAKFARMGIVNAELTKISVNAFVTTKISFANTLARICAALPGGDARAVAAAVGIDSRIGRKYLQPGATFGGPCFPRDNRAFAWLAGQLGAEAPIALATDEGNRIHVEFLAGLAEGRAGRTIGVLGLSYKPGTNLMEESLGTALARHFLTAGISVVAYDPRVAEHGATEDVPGLELMNSCEAVVDQADVIYWATDHDEFRQLTEKVPAWLAAGKMMIDVWGLFRQAAPIGINGYLDPAAVKKFDNK